VIDAPLVHAHVDRTDLLHPERFPLQSYTSRATRLPVSKIVGAVSAVFAANSQQDRCFRHVIHTLSFYRELFN
jgi:hypothetical protein